MRPKLLRAAIFTVILGLWLPVVVTARARAQASNPSDSATPNTKAAKTPAKLPLKDITFISTAEAARQVAEEIKVKASGQSASAPRASKSRQPENSGVLEFQPDKSGSSAGSESGPDHLKSHKKPVLKDIHGTFYGSTAAQGTSDHTAEGAIGASSSNGKLNVFVETQHSQTNSPAPH
jgi:hypothetical protein